MEQRIASGKSIEVGGIEDTCSEWRTALGASPASIRLDAAELAAIDTAGIQMLVAFRRGAARRGIDSSIEGATDLLADRAGILGLAGELR